MSDAPAVFRLERFGDAPLLLSSPHSGTALSPGLAQRLTPAGRALPDTDWHVDRLYEGIARQLGATFLRANYSRYVVDLNRDPTGTPLYAGAENTELCPTSTFDREPIYSDTAPDEDEERTRTLEYWQPYHDALRGELLRLREAHPAVLLYDCHSIPSTVPRFFEGELPHFNIGTAGGASAADAIGRAVLDACNDLAKGEFESVLNGRFRGGFITRAYGDPDAAGVHAVQMEIAQRTYMREGPPFAFDAAQAAAAQRILSGVLDRALAALSAIPE